MKKRTVKDFIALYAPEDEEKLVLIQDGVSADKTFLDTYWAAHTHALAMANIPSGLPRARSTGSKPAAGKVMPSTNLSGMSLRYWRKAYPVRHWRRFGRNTQSPFFWRMKCWGPSRWSVR